MQPIAIVAFDGVFPGAEDAAALWPLIRSGSQRMGPPPPGRWSRDPADLVDPAGGPDRIFHEQACFIADTPPLPADLDLPPEQLQGLDPIVALVLRAGAGAWRRVRRDQIDPRRCGVILGNIALPTAAAGQLAAQLLLPALGLPPPERTSDPRKRYVAGLPGILLARALGLGGGARTIDAACAAGLYSVALGMQELRAGRLDCVLAGGASRPDSLYTQMGFTALGALSRGGVCRPFDAEADGLIVGEGAGVLVLKRLQDAIDQGDRIHAVLQGYGLSNDQRGSLFSPDSDGQLRALTAAYRSCGWQPWDVQHIECHGTGTPVGDATELRSLRRLWQEAPAGSSAVLGSVKSNIGHLLTGAGAAGLIKALLAL
ncbi:MAG: polyketide synthase, partial [Planctomycetota bacterium]